MTNGPAPIFGIDPIDGALAPVVPPGWLGLIEGDSGSGLHLLAKQAAHVALGHLPVFYYTTHESASEISSVFDEFGWSAAGLTIADLDHEVYDPTLARDLAITQARERGLSLSDATTGATRSGPVPSPALVERVLTEIAPLREPFRFVLDSFDLFLERLNPREATTVARQLRHQAVLSGGGALLVLQPSVPDERTLALLEGISDFVVELEREQDGDGFSPMLTLRRVRNHPERTRVVHAEVTREGLVARAG